MLFAACVARGYRVATRDASALDRLLVPLLRRLVAAPVLARLGGRLRLAVVGGAALDPDLARTFIGLGLPVLQGYGMTEASPVISVNRDDDNVPDSVGPPLAGIAVRLGEANELHVRGAERDAGLLARRGGDGGRARARTGGCARAIRPRSRTASSTFADA